MSYKFKDTSKIKYCPLCRDDLISTDTYQCGCGYIICYECYNDIRAKENQCPKCKKEYANEKQTNERKKRYQPEQRYQKQNKSYQKKQPSLQDLSQVRIIKKNLVYIIGLSPQIAKEEILAKKEYFGQYGKITKIVVNKMNIYNPNGKTPSFSAFITYSNEKEASFAVLAIEEFEIHGRTIRASYGTTKYCTSFLNNQECPNKEDCLYLHSFGKERDTYAKDEILQNKNIFTEQQKIAFRSINKSIPELVKLQLKYDQDHPKVCLPHPSTIIKKLVDATILEQSKIDQIEQELISQNKQSSDEKFTGKVTKTPLVDQWSNDVEIPSQPIKPPKQIQTIEDDIPIQIQEDTHTNNTHQQQKKQSHSNNSQISTTQEENSQSSFDLDKQQFNSNTNEKNDNLEANSPQMETIQQNQSENEEQKLDLYNKQEVKKNNSQNSIPEQQNIQINSPQIQPKKNQSQEKHTENVQSPVKNQSKQQIHNEILDSTQKSQISNTDSIEQKIINSLFSDESSTYNSTKQQQQPQQPLYSNFGQPSSSHLNSFFGSINNIYNNNLNSSKTSSRFAFAQSEADEENNNQQQNNSKQNSTNQQSETQQQTQQSNQSQFDSFSQKNINNSNYNNCFGNMLYCNNFDSYSNKQNNNNQAYNTLGF